MDDDAAIRVFGALAHRTRARAYRLLASAGEAGMDNGQIATAVETSNSVMSRHLAILADSGLVVPRRHGRRIVYTIGAGVLDTAARHVSTEVAAAG